MTITLDGTKGTTTPGLYSSTTFTGTYTDGIVVDYTTGTGRISVGTADGLTIYNGGVASTALVAIDSSGNVGIGTTSPSSKLHVAAPNSGIIVSGGAGTATSLILAANGNTAGSSSVDVIQGGDSSGYLYNRANAAMYFGTNNTTRMSINAGAPILCLSGGNTSATGTGIAFPATQSASSDANTLDDYEEGTWTPTLLVATGTPTYNYQEGRYTKIGNVVVCGGIVGVSNSASLTGNINVSLPFPTNNTTYGATAGSTSDGSGFTWPINGGYSLSMTINGGSNQSYSTAIVVGASPNGIGYNSGGVANSWYFRFKFVYIAA